MQFYAFDLPSAVDLPLIERKEALRKLIPKNPTIHWLPHNLDPVGYFELMKATDEEGIILKDPDSRYVFERSFSWLKVKNWRLEICNVVGYTPGKNARSSFFGALVLAREEKFRGCVGSGFNDWDLRRLKDLFADAPKVDNPFDIGEPYTAVRTDLKVLVKYYKATDANVLRFPVLEKVLE